MAARRIRYTSRCVARACTVVLFASVAFGQSHAQSRVDGELALASRLVDRGLPVSAATPILQGSLSWVAGPGWSFALAGAVELRSPGRPVLVLGRATRTWSLSGDWLAQASVLHYDHRGTQGAAIPDRTDASVYFVYRDLLSVGVSAMHPDTGDGGGVLGAADAELNLPLSRALSLSAGAGVAEVVVAAYSRGGYNGHDGYGADPGRTRIRRYGFGSLGLDWHQGPWRVGLDRHFNSLGSRRVYGGQTPPQWVVTGTWSF